LIGVIRGDSQLYFAGPNFVKDFVATGRLRALAVTGSERLASAPDVPTVEEAGLKGFSYKAWIGIFAPAGTPEHLRDQISSELRSVMDLPDFRDALSIQGLTVVKGNPRDLDQLVQEEVSSLERLLKRHAN
jgi:tripartite-type tricarboxylate transporter receptor subunit TctC